LGQRASNEVFPALRQIHVYLVGQGENSLLALLRKQSLKENNDMYVHYSKLRAVLIEYYLIQARAIELLKLVIADPNVDFTEGPKVVEDINGHIDAQEAFFAQMIPADIVNLCLALARESQMGQNISISNVPVGGGIHPGDKRQCFATKDGSKQWAIKPSQSLTAPDKSKAKEHDYFIFFRDGNEDRYMYFTRSPYGIYGNVVAYTFGDACTTYMSDIFKSSVKWRLKMNDNGKVNLVRKPGWTGGATLRLTGPEDVTVSEAYSLDDPKTQFNIRLWA
jgi:hypothetical protein